MLFSAVAAQWFIEDALDDKSVSRARTRVLPYREFVQAINGQAANGTALAEAEKHLQTFFGDKMQNGYFDTRKAEARFLELKPIPVAHRFKRVFILIGPATYSSAVNFARYLKIANKNVILVGEETGSPGDGHSAEILVSASPLHSENGVCCVMTLWDLSAVAPLSAALSLFRNFNLQGSGILL